MKKIIYFLLIFGLIIGSFVFAKTMEPGQSNGGTQGPGSMGGDIAVQMPQVEFIYPTEGGTLKGVENLKIKVKEAYSVEFYLRRPESLQEIYLGKAASAEDDCWQLIWDTIQTPNGEYLFFPKITNKYGQYSSSEIKIKIDNEIQRYEAEEEVINQQVQQADQIEEQQIQETQTANQSIVQESQNSTQQSLEYMEEEGKEEVKLKVEEKLEESSQELKKNLEEFSEKVKEEVNAPHEKKKEIQQEKEEIKKDILEKTSSPIKLIEEKAKEEDRGKFLEFKEILEKETKSSLEKLEEKINDLEGERAKIVEEISKDSDKDGLTDQEEIRLKTNPFNPDTDGDSYLDGAEYKTGYNPLKPGPADKIIYQDPQKVEPKKTNVYKVERVEAVILPGKEVGLKFEGKGLPNSFVTVYVFSSAIVMTTRTDGNGSWSLVLDKALSDGYHEVYVAVTDNQGEITARSDPLVFLKSGEKVAAIVLGAFPTEETIFPTKAVEKSFLLLIVGIIALAIGIALTSIGFLTRKRPV